MASGHRDPGTELRKSAVVPSLVNGLRQDLSDDLGWNLPQVNGFSIEKVTAKRQLEGGTDAAAANINRTPLPT